ncbi:VOC family protein [Erythrobacter sp. HL-111]|uniref:VOC family protein n=1 Tax=Erythrobacter sp. HL-111 TaxID=1798193 RepID=UPI0006DB48EF|nr:VOC family protein [Erythrobacter sp. HL-111]KPP94870.1 MAG: putative lyase [Erythrobacteraceae bacterium HL-111]SDS89021.1 Catechol 2,3-dioxygenase [Erythrobacter sp. HL-111]
MRVTALLAALLAGCSGTMAQETPHAASGPKAAGVDAPAERLPTDVRRATIIVRDIENSLRLYRDVIGLAVNYDTTVETSGVALPAGEPGATARLVLLNANDPWVGWIGLMEWIDPAIPAGDYPRRMGPGDVVLVLNTDDVEGRCARAKEIPGVTFTAEPRLQVYPGRDGGADIRVKGCNFFDPDGILIELNQILD